MSRQGIATDPLVVADITARRRAGESFAAIAARHGVTRERIRQLCCRWGVEPDKPAGLSDAQLLTAVEFLRAGDRTLEEAADFLGVASSTLRAAAKRRGIDLNAAREEGRTHKYDGQTFDLWTVVPGSYVLTRENRTARSVECRCACGTVKRVLLHNLLSRASRGCGCRNTSDSLHGRKRVPWVCQQTGERVENTAELADRLEINYMIAMRRRNKGESIADSNGNVWVPLDDEAVSHTPGVDLAIPWRDLDSKDTWPHAKALAEHLGLHHQGLWRCVYEGRAYPSADGRFFGPVDRADTLRREERKPWAPPTPWRCVETGETWPTRQACAEAIGASPNTMSNWINRGGYVDAQGHHYLPVEQEAAA